MSENIENLSWGKIIEKDNIKNITLPQEIIKELSENINYNRFLVVFTSRKKLIKIDIFPFSENEIVKIQLKLSQFSGESVKKIGEIIQKMNFTKNFYTSGVCITSNICLYEVYLEFKEFKYSIEELEKEFNLIDNLIGIYIQKLT